MLQNGWDLESGFLQNDPGNRASMGLEASHRKKLNEDTASARLPLAVANFSQEFPGVRVLRKQAVEAEFVEPQEGGVPDQIRHGTLGATDERTTWRYQNDIGRSRTESHIVQGQDGKTAVLL